MGWGTITIGTGSRVGGWLEPFLNRGTFVILVRIWERIRSDGWKSQILHIC